MHTVGVTINGMYFQIDVMRTVENDTRREIVDPARRFLSSDAASTILRKLAVRIVEGDEFRSNSDKALYLCARRDAFALMEL